MTILAWQIQVSLKLGLKDSRDTSLHILLHKDSLYINKPMSLELDSKGPEDTLFCKLISLENSYNFFHGY